MSETVVLWIFGTVIGVQTVVLAGVVSAVWMLVRETHKNHGVMMAALAEFGARLSRVEQDVGTHDTGMRGDVHSLRDLVTPFVIRAQMEMERK